RGYESSIMPRPPRRVKERRGRFRLTDSLCACEIKDHMGSSELGAFFHRLPRDLPGRPLVILFTEYRGHLTARGAWLVRGPWRSAAVGPGRPAVGGTPPPDALDPGGLG